MSKFDSKLRTSAVVAGRSALVIAVTTATMVLVRVVINGLFDGKWKADWRMAFELLVIFAGVWFVLIFLYTFFKLRADESSSAPPMPKQFSKTSCSEPLETVQLPYVARYPKKVWFPMFAFWLAMSAYFLLHPIDTWTNGNWAYKLTTIIIVGSPVLVLLEFVVQKLTFTETEIQRTTRMGRIIRYPYSSIRGFAPATDAVLKIQFEDGRELKIYRWVGSLSQIVSILNAQSSRGVGMPV
jgi:hypothetical protein